MHGVRRVVQPTNPSTKKSSVLSPSLFLLSVAVAKRTNSGVVHLYVHAANAFDFLHDGYCKHACTAVCGMASGDRLNHLPLLLRLADVRGFVLHATTWPHRIMVLEVGQRHLAIILSDTHITTSSKKTAAGFKK
jgi:hypothetical protein